MHSESTKRTWAPAGGLAQLIHPVTPEVFREHWDKTPLHIKGTPEKFRPLMDWERFEALIRSASASKLTVTFADPGNRIFEREGTRPVIWAEKGQVESLRVAGASLTFEELHHHDERLADLARSLKRDIGHAGDVKVHGWHSPSGMGVPVHFDGLAVIALQIGGTKRWRISRKPALRWPETFALGVSEGRAAYTRDPDGAGRQAWEYQVEPRDETDFLEVTLAPGDLLYMPAGTWHTTAASDEGPSLGLSITFAPAGFWDLLAQVSRPILRARPAWRSLPPAFGRDQGGDPVEELDRFFSERLDELQHLISKYQKDRSRFHEMWSRQLASRDAPTPVVTDQPPRRAVKAAVAPPTVRPDSVLAFPDARLPVVCAARDEEGREVLHVFDGDSEVCFDDPQLLPFARKLVTQRRFVASEACAWAPNGAGYSWERVQSLLESLVGEGVLELQQEELGRQESFEGRSR